MRSTSRLELAVDKSVFYTAAEINDIPFDISSLALEALIKIYRECHRIVMSSDYLNSITGKLKRYSEKTAAEYTLHMLNHIIRTENKVKFVPTDIIKRLNGIPQDDMDIATFALISRSRILLVADIDEKLADEKLIGALEKRYNIRVLSCKQFLEESF